MARRSIANLRHPGGEPGSRANSTGDANSGNIVCHADEFLAIGAMMIALNETHDPARRSFCRQRQRGR